MQLGDYWYVWELMWGCWLQFMVATPMQTLHKHQWCCFWSKWNVFGCSCKKGLVLTSIIQFNIWTLGSNFQGILLLCVVRNMWQFTYSQSKVANLLWFWHFGTRICKGAQLSNCSYLVDHTSILLMVKWIWLARGLFWGIKHDISLFLQIHKLNI